MSSLLKKIYFLSLKSCEHPRAPWVLGILSFTESCFFVIPPELLLLPMCYANRAKAWFYALVTTLTSVAGALAGYFIGMWLWGEVQFWFFEYIPGFEHYFEIVGEKYGENAVLALFLAAFTPIPFKVFTVAAGVYSHHIGIGTLILISLLGRGVRYFMMAGLIYFVGEKAKDIIERYFKPFVLIVALVGVGAILVKFF